MDSYQVLASKVVDDTIFLEVEYNINGVKRQVTMPSFQPLSKADVELSLQNRFQSEKRALECKQLCDTIIQEIELNRVVDIV